MRQDHQSLSHINILNTTPMKYFTFLLLLCLTLTFEMKNTVEKATTAKLITGDEDSVAATPVPKLQNLKWTCQSCASSCAYTGFPRYCASTDYCVCTYQYYCPSCIGNVC